MGFRTGARCAITMAGKGVPSEWRNTPEGGKALFAAINVTPGTSEYYPQPELAQANPLKILRMQSFRSEPAANGTARYMKHKNFPSKRWNTLLHLSSLPIILIIYATKGQAGNPTK